MKKLFLFILCTIYTVFIYSSFCFAYEGIDGIDEENNIEGAISTHVGAADPHTGYMLESCSGSTTYQDGDGNCDDISATYSSKSQLSPDPINCTTGDVLGTNCGVGVDMRMAPIVQIASGTVELMAVTQGRACVFCTTAAVCGVDPNILDRFIFEGASAGDGKKLVSDGTIAAYICFYKDSADGWTAVNNPGGHWSAEL